MADEEEFMDIRVTLGQAREISNALDLKSRLGTGQFDMIGEALRMGSIPAFVREGSARPSIETMERVDALLEQIKQELGYPRNGGYSIGSGNVPDSAKRGWEIKKVVDKALAYHAEPNPSFKGVNYDGVIVRYTNEPLPTAEIVETATGPKP